MQIFCTIPRKKNVNVEKNDVAMGNVKWLWEQNNPKRWFLHPLKKGRKVIYLFVRTFRWRKAVRNHLVNRQSKDRRACHLLQWVNSLLLQPSVCEMCYLDGLKTLSAPHVYVTSSPASLSLCKMRVRVHTPATECVSQMKARPEERNANQRIPQRIFPKPDSTSAACPCCHVLAGVDGPTD